jgi:glycosyltransferase involved in cell wall biosynthesis
MRRSTSLEKTNIYVFSYNRGGYLKNCLSSIEKSFEILPNIFIVDDCSDEPSTVEILNELRKTYPVFPSFRNDQHLRLGALYQNMNWALSHARLQGQDYALFLQDDMQLVRTVTAAEFGLLCSQFQNHPNMLQIGLTFWKTKNHLGTSGKMRKILVKDLLYFRSNEPDFFYASFIATGLFHITRVSELLGSFLSSEKLNQKLCERKNLVVGFYRDPFAMYLPFPKVYRGKKVSLLLRLSQTIGRSGFYPLCFMSDEEKKKLRDRDMDILPTADRFLKPKAIPACKEWSVAGGGFRNASALGGWRKALNSILIRLDKLFSRRD